MKEDMKGIIILNALFPPRTKMYKLITYKVINYYLLPKPEIIYVNVISIEKTTMGI